MVKFESREFYNKVFKEDFYAYITDDRLDYIDIYTRNHYATKSLALVSMFLH